jgi:hypothetical protein
LAVEPYILSSSMEELVESDAFIDSLGLFDIVVALIDIVIQQEMSCKKKK